MRCGHKSVGSIKTVSLAETRLSRLAYIQRVVPTPDTELKPPFGIDRALERPRPPGVEVLLTQILIGDFVPHTSTVVTDFNTLGPSAATERPASECDLAVVDDDVVVDRRHDCR